VANTPSAKKRARQAVKRTSVNKSRISRVRTFVRKVEEAIAKGDAEQARMAFAAAEPEMRRGVTKGVLHLNTVSRKISRLARRVKAIAANPA
jgi:small subunit ribosomal protein S20